MSSPIFKAGQLVLRGGSIVFSDAPELCECCVGFCEGCETCAECFALINGVVITVSGLGTLSCSAPEVEGCEDSSASVFGYDGSYVLTPTFPGSHTFKYIPPTPHMIAEAHFDIYSCYGFLEEVRCTLECTGSGGDAENIFCSNVAFPGYATTDSSGLTITTCPGDPDNCGVFYPGINFFGPVGILDGKPWRELCQNGASLSNSGPVVDCAGDEVGTTTTTLHLI